MWFSDCRKLSMWRSDCHSPLRWHTPIARIVLENHSCLSLADSASLKYSPIVLASSTNSKIRTPAFFSSKKSSSSSFPYLPKVSRLLPLVLSSVVSSENLLSLSRQSRRRFVLFCFARANDDDKTKGEGRDNNKKKMSFFRGKIAVKKSEKIGRRRRRKRRLFFQVCVTKEEEQQTNEDHPLFVAFSKVSLSRFFFVLWFWFLG